MEKMSKGKTFLLSFAILTFMILMLIPFYMVILNSFKTIGEIGKNVLSMPGSFIQTLIKNYAYSYDHMNFFQALKNTFIITVVGNVGLIVFATMTGYWLVRKQNKINNLIYILYLAAMAIPFQATMIPFVKVMYMMGMSGRLVGVSFAYLGMCCPMVIFLTSGAIKSIPIDIEDSAAIDGCTQLGIFFKVVFPNLRTIIVTFTILNVFYMWNDYLLPFLMLGVNKRLYTIQIALKVFSGEYGIRWDYLLPGIVLSMIVPLILFFICEKLIIEGMVSGSVKG